MCGGGDGKADELLRACRFAEAAAAYRECAAQRPHDAQAWWGVTLSDYGVRFLRDEESNVLLPACRSAVPVSIWQSASFCNAMAYADERQRETYKKIACVIDDLQRRIGESEKESERCDAFVSCAFTDARGRRTGDASVAYAVCDALRCRDLRPFFAALTPVDREYTGYERIARNALSRCKYFAAAVTDEESVETVVRDYEAFYAQAATDGGRKAACVYDVRLYARIPSALRENGVRFSRADDCRQVACELAQRLTGK